MPRRPSLPHRCVTGRPVALERCVHWKRAGVPSCTAGGFHAILRWAARCWSTAPAGTIRGLLGNGIGFLSKTSHVGLRAEPVEGQAGWRGNPHRWQRCLQAPHVRGISSAVTGFGIHSEGSTEEGFAGPRLESLSYRQRWWHRRFGTAHSGFLFTSATRSYARWHDWRVMKPMLESSFCLWGFIASWRCESCGIGGNTSLHCSITRAESWIRGQRRRTSSSRHHENGGVRA